MAYGVIIYEDEHQNFLNLSPEDAGNVIQNMIRTFQGQETKELDGVLNCYSISLCNRVSADKKRANIARENGSKGGAPKGNQNAKTSKKQPKSSNRLNQKQPKTNYNYNSNYNSNNNKDIYGSQNNVLLTKEEYEKLKEKFTDFQDRIETLSLYIASKGDHYKCHYATILNWARKESKEEKGKVIKETPFNTGYMKRPDSDYDYDKFIKN